MTETKRNKSVENKEKRLLKQREYKTAQQKKAQQKNRNNEQNGQPLTKEINNEKTSCLNSHIPISQLIDKFHKSISTGPLYVCSCCEQLWYKHSVCSADRLKFSNPDSTKYLQNIMSVDNIEWLCLTCNNYLKKDKIPPCVIAIKLPSKT